MQLPVLFQNQEIVVVDKAIGVPTHAAQPDDPYPADALRIVQLQLGLSYLGMHQRLDADTSGTLLFSASKEANPSLAAAFEGRDVIKQYMAIVHGAPQQPTGTISAPMARGRDGLYRVTTRSDPQAQAAVTRYRLVESSPDGRYSLLKISPETGRTHQIRVHLAHAGMSVAGDVAYGPPSDRAPRLCLHADRLTLSQWGSGTRLSFASRMPHVFDRVGTGLPEFRLADRGLNIRDAVADREALLELMRLALERRAPLGLDPDTEVYRLINGAGDGLPGLTVDRYGDALVMALYDEQVTPDKAPQALVEVLAETTGLGTVYAKYRPREAGRLREEELEALAPTDPILGPHRAEIMVREDGLAFLIHPGDGLSTGIFGDMRETRGRVRAWAKGRRVLNCFAYTCAFGVAASAGGAMRVLNLDLSKQVLERGQANYRLNGLPADPHDFVYGDVFDWLTRLGRRGEHFDMVILDPPGFSRTKTGRFSAARDYEGLARLGAALLDSNGILLACTNVAELSWRRFRDKVLAGVQATGRVAEVIGVYHEPRVDFPVARGQEPYLKVIAVRAR